MSNMRDRGRFLAAFRGRSLPHLALALTGLPLLLAAPASAAGPHGRDYGRIVEVAGACGTGVGFVIARGGASLRIGRAAGHRPGHRFVPGHWAWRTDAVLLRPASWHRVWIDPVFEWRIEPCGARTRVLAAPGHWQHVRVEAVHESRRTKVRVPGRWEPVACGGGGHGHDDRGRRRGRGRRG